MTEEMNRAKAVTGIASQIIKNGALVLRAQEVTDNFMNADTKKPKMLEG